MADEKTKEVLVLQVPTSLKSLVEALVFAAKEPLTLKQMKDIYEGDGPQSYLRQLDAEEVEACISELNAEYESAEKPYRIVKIAGGYQFATLSSYADWIGRLYKEQGRRKLSQSGIESLAIIAYKQPVTKADIESIRGVNCDYVLKTLLEKELVTVVGRAHAPGRPLLYGTTREFLKHFGLNEITDLPRPREIEEILGESQFETERRMLEAQAGAEKMKTEEPDFKSRLPHIPKKKPELDQTVEIKPKSSQLELKTVNRTDDVQEEGVGKEHSAPEPERRPEIRPDSPDVKIEVEVSADYTTDTVIPSSAVEQSVDEEIMDPGIPDVLPPAEGENTAGEGAEQSVDGKSPELESSKVDTSVRVEVLGAPEVPLREPLVESLPHHQQGAADANQPAVNKSKWQTWKEKVQGFIRKIFG